jgi:recombination protein RecA
MEDEFGKASFGASAKLFSEGLKKLNPYISRFHVSLILVTQMRAKIGFIGHGPTDTPSGGGFAPRFYASWRARVSKGEEIVDGKEVIGNQIKIKNSKSKICYPKREAILDLFYGTGFNADAEYIDFIVQLGIVKKKGAWYSQDEWGFKGQGAASLLNFLKDRRELFEKVKAEVNKTFATFSILDEADAESTDADLAEDGTELPIDDSLFIGEEQ